MHSDAMPDSRLQVCMCANKKSRAGGGGSGGGDVVHDGGHDLVSLALDGTAEQVVPAVRLSVRVVGQAILGRRQRVWPVA